MSEFFNKQENLWLLRHPKSSLISFWLLIPFLLLLSIFGFLYPVIENKYDWANLILMPSIGCFIFWICIPSLKAFPYLKSNIEFGENGFTVYFSSTKFKSYKWNEVGQLKNNKTFQVLEVFDKSNKRILAVNKEASSFNKFIECAERNIAAV